MPELTKPDLTFPLPALEGPWALGFSEESLWR